MKTSIIIPNYNGVHVLADCIYSIKQYTNTECEIIVVDNGSSDQSLSFCRNEKLTFISLKHNRGYPAACNIGMKAASGDAVLLLNNDTIVSPHWLDTMLECLYSDAQIGAVGPMSNFVSGKQMISIPYTNVEDVAYTLQKKNRWSWLETSRIVGLCFLMKREVMDRVGGLDERFSPGYYEDDDYCYRIRQAGYTLRIVQDAFIFHHGGSSFSKEGDEAVNQLLARNRQLFIDKWGVDPQSFI